MLVLSRETVGAKEALYRLEAEKAVLRGYQSAIRGICGRTVSARWVERLRLARSRSAGIRMLRQQFGDERTRFSDALMAQADPMQKSPT